MSTNLEITHIQWALSESYGMSCLKFRFVNESHLPIIDNSTDMDLLDI